MSSYQYGITASGIAPLSAIGANGSSYGTLSINGSTGTGVTNSKTMDLKVTPANNGTIVSIKTGDYSDPELYVIHNDQDLGQEIGKIITMIILKKE